MSLCGSEILARVDELGEIRHVSAVTRFARVAIKGGRTDKIAEMRLRTVLAGDIPAAPAVGERGPVRDLSSVRAGEDFAPAVGPQRAHEMPRHAHRPSRDVALDAILIAHERRLFLRHLVE